MFSPRKYLKERGHQDWPNVRMTLAEILFVYIVATRFFYGNIERAHEILKDSRYINKGVSKGRLNARLPATHPQIWHDLIRFAYEQRRPLGLSKEILNIEDGKKRKFLKDLITPLGKDALDL